MSDSRDFTMDAGDLQPAADPPGTPAATAAPAPKVVIEYRSRGVHMMLLPPLLIAVTALMITSYQRQARLRPPARPATVPAPEAPAVPAGQGRTIMVDASETGAAVEPITVRIAPAPLPATAPDRTPVATATATPTASPPPVQAPAAAVPPEPVRKEARARPPLNPPAPLTSTIGEWLSPDSPERAFRVVAEAVAEAAAEAEPRLSKEQILLGIQAEAQQKKAEQQNLEREVALSKAREMWETIRRTQAERLRFHDDLRRLLRELDDGAGAEIKALCERYGREVHPDIQKAVTLALNRSAASTSRKVKIALMRVNGVPETLILDYLANELDATRNSRGGPRDRNEVRVRAARLLLKYPPPAPAAEKSAAPDRKPTTTTTAATVARTPAAAVPRPARPAQ
jgi:hypothetical protein